MYQIYHAGIHPSTALFHPPSLIPGTVSTIIITFYTCVYIIYTMFILLPLSLDLPLPISADPHSHKAKPIPPLCSQIL
jgi:hypothetical protein